MGSYLFCSFLNSILNSLSGFLYSAFSSFSDFFSSAFNSLSGSSLQLIELSSEHLSNLCFLSGSNSFLSYFLTILSNNTESLSGHGVNSSDDSSAILSGQNDFCGLFSNRSLSLVSARSERNGYQSSKCKY